MSDQSTDSAATPTEILGHALPIGIAIAIGLAAVPGWGFIVVAVAVAISAVHILFRSAHYQAFQEQLGGRGSKGAYFVQSLLWESIKIGVIASAAMFIRSWLFE